MKKTLTMVALSAALAGAAQTQSLQAVATLSVYAAVTREIGGDRVEATSIARGDEDAHFVKPKPSFALRLKSAELFVTTGLDLELWAPILVDKSGNRSIRDGQPGFVSASQGVELLDVPVSASREAGDVHIYGNPHVHTSPIAIKRVAANIAAGLERVDPAGAAVYRRNLEDFRQRIDEALYGPELLPLLGSETLDTLAAQGKLIAFLESQRFEDRPMIDRLGGWLGRGLAFRGRKIIAYHKNWIYFTDLFGLEVVDYVEPKPGIPPSARHVKELIDEIEEQGIEVLIAANYFDAKKPQTIADRTGARAVILPLGTGVGGAADYFALVDLWVDSVARAFAGGGV
ncbi:MAG: metal ABC transporter substrate-binding protein [Acidobacteria bacterium]|nr:metal ABC transporter substrate-binding protein [Acidobacteriota bacterium]